MSTSAWWPASGWRIWKLALALGEHLEDPGGRLEVARHAVDLAEGHHRALGVRAVLVPVGVEVVLVAQQVVEELDRRAPVARVEVDVLEGELLRLRLPAGLARGRRLARPDAVLAGLDQRLRAELEAAEASALDLAHVGRLLHHGVATAPEPDLDSLVADVRRHRSDRLDPIADLRLAVLEALDLELDLRRLRARIGRVAAPGAVAAARVAAASTAAAGAGERVDGEEEQGDRRQRPRGDLGELHGARFWQTAPSARRPAPARQSALLTRSAARRRSRC